MSVGGEGGPQIERAEAAASDSPTAWVLGQSTTRLDAGWERLSTAPNAWTTPAEADAAGPWCHAHTPATVASLDDAETAISADTRDHWFRLKLTTASSVPHTRRVLCFDGLATIAEVWLDGTSILVSDNMFLAHACDVTSQLARAGEHVLMIRFSALRPVLQQRRPRGRWPTRLISQKHLRFVRTSLLGYMPGWYPELPVVGPWRPIRLVEQRGVVFERCTLRPVLEGNDGLLSIDAEARVLDAASVDRATLCMEGSHPLELGLTRTGNRVRMAGVLRVPQVAKWWPHTHGDPALHASTLVLSRGGSEQTIDLGRVGFRSLEIDRGADGQGFALRINGCDVFCRGACWSPLDPKTLHVGTVALRATLEQARDAGFNMLRVGGTMVYEHDDFYAACDALGILVWQDFMFANFDYPVDDEVFVESCRREARQLMDRVGSRCSLAVLCGGSEVQQQASMMGLPREQWSNVLFDELLPGVSREARVDATYVPSTPSGGALPFHVNAGVGHYYGVGAYLRPLTDVRIADVRFASECLAFSNPPEPSTLRRWLGSDMRAALDPRYRTSVPRDPGAAWDFADVADHYLSLSGCDGRALRESDPDRYLDLSRVAVGDAMSAVMNHMRCVRSTSRGALVWMLRDPHRAAGWGVIDGDGEPKAVYYFLKRACVPRALWLSDEGVNGLTLHADNERDEAWRGRLEVSLYRPDGLRVAHAERDVEVSRGGQDSWSVEALLGHFADASYAYRFGPPGHRLVTARWINHGNTLTSTTAFCDVLPAQPLPAAAIEAQVVFAADGFGELRVECPTVCGYVAVDLPEAILADNYFRVVPGVAHRVQVRLRDPNLRSVAGVARVVGADARADVKIAFKEAVAER